MVFWYFLKLAAINFLISAKMDSSSSDEFTDEFEDVKLEEKDKKQLINQTSEEQENNEYIPLKEFTSILKNSSCVLILLLNGN